MFVWLLHLDVHKNLHSSLPFYTRCCFEEVQRLREKNLLQRSTKDEDAGCDTSATESLSITSGSSRSSSSTDYSRDVFPPKGILKKKRCVASYGGEDTSATESMSLTSVSDVSNGSSSTDSRDMFPPRGILRNKTTKAFNNSGSLSTSTDASSLSVSTDESSEVTTTFSYLSSLSGSSYSTASSSDPYLQANNTNLTRQPLPVPILKRRSSRSSGSSSKGGSSGKGSQGSRVVFLGRDEEILY